jgi:hypothetical protein
MTRARDDHLWPLAQAERAALAKDLAGLSAEQWRHDTLCGEWDVEQVVAHLTAAASLNQWQWLAANRTWPSWTARACRPCGHVSRPVLRNVSGTSGA